MPIMKAYVFPHPPLAVPAVGRGQEGQIEQTLAALDEAARDMAALGPDTIIFISPHGTVYADYFHIAPGNRASGDLSRFRAAAERFGAVFDTGLIAAIEKQAAVEGIPAGTLGATGQDLDHGVTVPMWFINRHMDAYQSICVSPSGLEKTMHYRLGQAMAAALKDSEKKVVLVASGDLSHKLSAQAPYGHAPEGALFDTAICDIFSTGDFGALLSLEPGICAAAAECGHKPFLILAGCFDQQAVSSRLLSYEGPYGVGYAVAAVTPGGPDHGRNFLAQHEQALLLMAKEQKRGEDAYQALARQSLEHMINNGDLLSMPADLPEELIEQKAGVFVTLYKEGVLRGCIGTILPTADSLAAEIIKNAVSAGLHDNRFEAVSKAELAYLSYKVDVLGHPEDIDGPGELDVKRYGVIVSSGGRRGLLLPNLDGVDTVEEQLKIARNKAGIGEKDKVSLQRFEVIRHES